VASTKRLPDDRGWANQSRLPRGPGGRVLCRRCGKEVPPGRRTFCGDQCVHEWKLTTDPGYQREFVFRRDRGVCADCGLDTEELRRWRRYGFVIVEQYCWPPERQKIRVWEKPGFNYREGTDDDVRFYVSVDAETRTQVISFLRLSDRYMRGRESVPTSSLWDADHIVPVVEGGGGCDLSNLRTLCLVCHRKATADLAARRARKKKDAVGV
jgi:5-methylcytosine-specific restriction enzyme A